MTQAAALRIAIAAGGTGGHVYPGIAVARALMERYPDTTVQFIGHAGGLEERLVPREGFPLATVTVQALKGRSKLAQVRALGALGLGTLQALQVLRRLRPHLVIGAGGYVMAPVVFAATLLRIPRVLMEQNFIPGLTIRRLARYAQEVCTAFAETAAYLPGRAVTYTGVPVRAEIAQLAEGTPRQADGTLHLLVFGGSQGAHHLNQAMMQAAPWLAAQQERLRLVHQTGEVDATEVAQAYAQAGLQAEVLPFLHDMAARYQWADLVMCRAGASTLAELAISGTPAILVPYPYAADDHQRHNALAMQRQGGAQVILDADLSGARLIEALELLLSKPELLQEQAACSRAMGRPQAVAAIVEVCARWLPPSARGPAHA